MSWSDEALFAKGKFEKYECNNSNLIGFFSRIRQPQSTKNITFFQKKQQQEEVGELYGLLNH